MKAATSNTLVVLSAVRISIHAAREGGDVVGLINGRLSSISIHAAREGGDSIIGAVKLRTVISIHAAREGGDDPYVLYYRRGQGFQSTPPVKAATFTTRNLIICGVISIHAAREGGDNLCAGEVCVRIISIHAAREGGDAVTITVCSSCFISIHAAREGGDLPSTRRRGRKNDFNPRRP